MYRNCGSELLRFYCDEMWWCWDTDARSLESTDNPWRIQQMLLSDVSILTPSQLQLFACGDKSLYSDNIYIVESDLI